MGELRENWLTEGLIDFEYKKYLLLAYLSKVKAAFNKNELYPFLADLVAHYRNLLTINENKTLISDAISLEEVATIKELEAIVSFAIPEFKSSLDDGAQIYEFVEANCEISPIGLSSLYGYEGYLFLSQPPDKETNVYRYQLTIFEPSVQASSEPMRGLHIQHVKTTERSLANTYEHIKLQLIREFSALPNPSVYLITSKLRFPYVQTLMPVAKRLLIKQLSAA